MDNSDLDISFKQSDAVLDNDSKLTKQSAFEKLKAYFDSFVMVPPSELFHFIKLIRFKKIKKNDHFYLAGSDFNKIGFVLKGLLYNYYVKKNGDEVVNYFIPEGNPATCYADLLTNSKPSFSCKALEDTYLITVNFSDFRQLFDRHRCWDRMGRLGAEKQYIEKEIREKEFLIMSGEERYDQFITKNSDIIDRIPQSLIATFIGIRPESLSRIRAGRKS